MTDEPREDDQDHEEPEIQPTPEFSIELDNLPSQGHLWIDRGLKQTCENAGHPYHEAWKIRRT